MTVIEAINLSAEYLEKKGVESSRLNAELLLAPAKLLQRIGLTRGTTAGMYCPIICQILTDELKTQTSIGTGNQYGRHAFLPFVVVDICHPILGMEVIQCSIPYMVHPLGGT